MDSNQNLRTLALRVLDAQAAVEIFADESYEDSQPGFSLRCYAYASALVQLMNAMEKLVRAIPIPERDRFEARLENFKAAHPGHRYVRNVAEHFDDYLAGEGRLQKPTQDRPALMPKTPPHSKSSFFMITWWDQGAGRGHKTIHVDHLPDATNREFRLDIDGSNVDARTLANETWDDLDESGLMNS